MAEERFTPTDSLQLIQDMIQRSRSSLVDNSFYFLMWGWLVFVASILQYALLVFWQVKHHYLAWLLIIPAMIVTIVRSSREDARRGVVSYVDESMGWLWKGIGFSFNAMMLIFFLIGWGKAYPFFVLAYGTGTFISGGIIRFRPLQIGGFICWILAVVTAVLPYPYQILMLALSVAISYLIPGYLLRRKVRNVI